MAGIRFVGAVLVLQSGKNRGDREPNARHTVGAANTAEQAGPFPHLGQRRTAWGCEGDQRVVVLRTPVRDPRPVSGLSSKCASSTVIITRRRSACTARAASASARQSARLRPGRARPSNARRLPARSSPTGTERSSRAARARSAGGRSVRPTPVRVHRVPPSRQRRLDADDGSRADCPRGDYRSDGTGHKKAPSRGGLGA
jgi:hypothetical protein